MKYLLWNILWYFTIANVKAVIMPPPWADPLSNPCALQPRGWQLLFWPLDGKCYKIFQVNIARFSRRQYKEIKKNFSTRSAHLVQKLWNWVQPQEVVER